MYGLSKYWHTTEMSEGMHAESRKVDGNEKDTPILGIDCAGTFENSLKSEPVFGFDE